MVNNKSHVQGSICETYLSWRLLIFVHIILSPMYHLSEPNVDEMNMNSTMNHFNQHCPCLNYKAARQESLESGS